MKIKDEVLLFLNRNTDKNNFLLISKDDIVKAGFKLNTFLTIARESGYKVSTKTEDRDAEILCKLIEIPKENGIRKINWPEYKGVLNCSKSHLYRLASRNKIRIKILDKCISRGVFYKVYNKLQDIERRHFLESEIKDIFGCHPEYLRIIARKSNIKISITRKQRAGTKATNVLRLLQETDRREFTEAEARSLFGCHPSYLIKIAKENEIAVKLNNRFKKKSNFMKAKDIYNKFIETFNSGGDYYTYLDELDKIFGG